MVNDTCTYCGKLEHWRPDCPELSPAKTMEYTTEYWQEMADEIMDNFNFDKVHRCMVALDWTWHRIGVPDKHEIRQSARRMLREAIIGQTYGSGGFEVHIDRADGCLELKFVVESWDAYKELTQ